MTTFTQSYGSKRAPGRNEFVSLSQRSFIYLLAFIRRLSEASGRAAAAFLPHVFRSGGGWEGLHLTQGAVTVIFTHGSSVQLGPAAAVYR